MFLSDSRFPKDFRVTFHLTPDQTGNNQQQNGYIFQSPLVRTMAPTDLAKADSIENISLGEFMSSASLTHEHFCTFYFHIFFKCKKKNAPSLVVSAVRVTLLKSPKSML